MKEGQKKGSGEGQTGRKEEADETDHTSQGRIEERWPVK